MTKPDDRESAWPDVNQAVLAWLDALSEETRRHISKHDEEALTTSLWSALRNPL